MQATLAVDSEGFLKNLNDWNKNVAVALAQSEQLTLSTQHEELIAFLRDFYQEYQHIPKMRALIKAIAQALGSKKGQSTYFYQFFPGGLKQAAKIAGLPKPPHCI